MPHNNFLHSSCFNIPGAPEQLPAFSWFYIWFHRDLLKSPPHVPLHSFPHSCGFNISASPRLHSFLHAPSFGFNILDFRFSSHQLLAFILVSMSNFPSPTCLFLTNFQRTPGFNIYMFPRFSEHLLACILSQDLNSPHPLLAFIFGSQNFPLRLSAFFCMYLNVSSFRFNVWASPPHLSTTFCAHPVSISSFPFPLCARQFPASIPHWPLHHFLRFYCFNTGTSPASTTSCMHLVSVSKFPPPCARSKKRARDPAQCERL